ncbi:malonic semialdehyde reductase [Variovorax sp. WS11]|uniref:malonic semialdehyde reductase n=1 Tax=Variovorax sp. WS11 TaxID=1105204 RepID=UPI000D0DAFF7|nr:malonic semialdehyde reductase [Variovorax sp. WS11]NDZ17343.1 malonic semialdehyde reductase [Variovorax sp. WS11]PSL86117.1 malonic semialdehyde reductase [Variovorax sp. WS11]
MNLTIEQLFTEARTQNGYRDVPIADDTLRQLYDIVKWGPTSANCSPARFLFVRTPEARQRLIACVSPGNAEKVRQAPVTAIIGMDMTFYDHLPRLFPHTDARQWFANNPSKVAETAFRNSSLQGGYFILAARALGLDCGPMSGFDVAKVDEAMWAGTPVRTNFLCTLGAGDPEKLFPRSPRLAFEEACRFL